MSIKQIIELILPAPSPFKLIRIGGDRDGSYLLPNDLQGIEACFSPGVGNIKTFEDELSSLYKIKAHMCDFTADPTHFLTPLMQGMQTFEKVWLGCDPDTHTVTLEQWVSMYYPDSPGDFLLQMDIEGSEYRILANTPRPVLGRFRIIVIELHDLCCILDDLEFRLLALKALSKLSLSHVCVHAHPNNCCGYNYDDNLECIIPNVIELTFLRKDRFIGDPDLYFTPQIPHPLDITNAPPKAPVHLNKYWMKRPLTPASYSKMQEDYRLFLHHS